MVLAVGALAAGLITPAGSARAGAISPCDDVQVFQNAAVNTFIMQFGYSGGTDAPLSETARRLSLLVQIDALFSQLKYGSIGVQYLERLPGRNCGEEVVLAQIADRTGKGQAVVWLTGTLLEIGDEIFLATECRFFRKEISEEVTCTLELMEGKSVDFTCSLPLSSVAFAPRRLTQAEIAAIDTEFQGRTVVRPSPDTTLPGIPLPMSAGRFAYSVEEARDGWMKIRDHRGGLSGWIQAKGLSGVHGLRDKLPELDFVEATVAYFRSRIAEASHRPVSRSCMDGLRDGQRRFEARTSSREDPVPLALVKAMGAMVEVERADDGRGDYVGRLAPVFREISALMPHSSEAANFKAVADFHDCCTGREPLVTRGIDAGAFEKVLARDPRNLSALTNLSRICRLQLDNEGLRKRGADVDSLRTRYKLIQGLSRSRSREFRDSLQSRPVPGSERRAG